MKFAQRAPFFPSGPALPCTASPPQPILFRFSHLLLLRRPLPIAPLIAAATAIVALLAHLPIQGQPTDDADKAALAHAIQLSESGDVDSADLAYREWLDGRITRFGSDARETAVAWNHYGLFLKRSGHVSASREPLREALRIRRIRAGEDIQAVAVALSNLAGVESGLGNFGQAQRLYDEALKIWQRSAPNSRLAASCHGNVGILQETLGDSEQAELHFRQAAKILRSIEPDSLALATQLGSLARLARAAGKPETAAEHLEAALSIREKHNTSADHDPAGLLAALIEMGLLRIDQDRSEEAIGLFDRAMQLQTSPIDRIAVLSGRAQAMRRLGRPADAANDLRDALELTDGEKAGDLRAGRDIVAVLRRELAVSLLALGLREEALELTLSANAATVEQFQRLCSFGSVQQRFAFQNRQDWYGLLVALGAEEEIARLSLHVKGGALASAAKDHSLVARAGKLHRNRLSTIHKSKELLRTAYLTTNADSSQLASLWVKTQQRERELLHELGLRSGNGAGSSARRATTPGSVLAALDPRHLVLDYLRYHAGGGQAPTTEARYGAVAYPGGAEKSVWIDLGPAEPIDRQIVGFLNAADPDDPTKLAEAEQDLLKASRSLYRTLLAPVEDRLGRDWTVLSVCPADLTALVAFPALLDKDGRLAGERFRFRLVHQVSDAVEPNPVPRIQSAVLVGDPDFQATRGAAPAANAAPPVLPRLEGTAHETDALTKLLSGAGIETTELRRGDASEAAVRQAMAKAEGADIVHLATHGVFVDFQASASDTEGLSAPRPPYDPLLKSSLTLAGAEHALRSWIDGKAEPTADDGILLAAEIPETGLREPWLVTLSACDTGLGDLLGGEGTRGLRSAFFQVGARNLVVSLWEVPDVETTDLMIDFYRNLFATGTNSPREPSLAFHEAQIPAMLELRKTAGYQKAVNFFAAFQVYARGKPLFE